MTASALILSLRADTGPLGVAPRRARVPRRARAPLIPNPSLADLLAQTTGERSPFSTFRLLSQLGGDGTAGSRGVRSRLEHQSGHSCVGSKSPQSIPVHEQQAAPFWRVIAAIIALQKSLALYDIAYNDSRETRGR